MCHLLIRWIVIGYIFLASHKVVFLSEIYLWKWQSLWFNGTNTVYMNLKYHDKYKYFVRSKQRGWRNNRLNVFNSTSVKAREERGKLKEGFLEETCELNSEGQVETFNKVYFLIVMAIFLLYYLSSIAIFSSLFFFLSLMYTLESSWEWEICFIFLGI